MSQKFQPQTGPDLLCNDVKLDGGMMASMVTREGYHELNPLNDGSKAQSWVVDLPWVHEVTLIHGVMKPVSRHITDMKDCSVNKNATLN